MLDKVYYTVKDIAGDYAILESEKGENQVALFFLPLEIDIGSRVVYEDFQYSMATDNL